MLRKDGLARLSQVIDPQLIEKAYRRINVELGSLERAQDLKQGPDGGVDRSNHFSPDEDITNLFNLTPLRPLMTLLLGTETKRHYRLARGQVALSFPDDRIDRRYDQLVSKWRIDGLTQVHPVVLKHIHESNLENDAPNHENTPTREYLYQFINYDALVGVFVRNVRQNGGELCYFPGSHLQLSESFRSNPGRLDEIRAFGPVSLHKGEPLIDDRPENVAHCEGTAGDVFIANSLLALFDCPHYLSDVRYLVLFRVRGPSFTVPEVEVRGSTNDTLLHPLAHWKLLN